LLRGADFMNATLKNRIASRVENKRGGSRSGGADPEKTAGGSEKVKDTNDKTGEKGKMDVVGAHRCG